MYLSSSVREAYSMSKAGLIAALKPYVLGVNWSGCSKDELVGMWLERYGVKEVEVKA